MEKVVDLPILSIIYEGKDISIDVEKYLISFRYTDRVEGGADEIEIELDDSNGRWSNEWYSKKGDKIKASIDGYDCGEFEVDEIELSGPPRGIKIKALSAISSQKVRTKKTKRSENKTLRQIAQAVAKDSNLELFGTVPEIIIEGVTQHRMTDLKFLRKQSWKYGIVFNVKSGKLVFTDLKDLESREPSIELAETDLTEYSIKDKVSETYQDAIVKYHHPQKKKLITGTASVADTETIRNPDGVSFTLPLAADTLVVHERVDNEAQAKAQAKAHLYRANTQQQFGDIKTNGTMKIQAGNNVKLLYMGELSGIYHITSSTHDVVKSSGYTTSANIKRVAVIAKESRK